LLDDKSKLQHGDDQLFVSELIKSFGKRPGFKTPKGQSLEFIIQHFAGEVSIVTFLLTDDCFIATLKCSVTLYADDLALIAESDDELIKMINKWKDSVESRALRVNMNKTKVIISGKRQKVMQNAVRWPIWGLQ